MHLNTKIMAKKSQELTKTLMCSFDHPFQIVQHSCNPLASPSPQQIEALVINSVQAENTQKEDSICFVTFNIPFFYDYCEKIVEKLGEGWKCMVYEFDPRDGSITEISQEKHSKSLDMTYILQLLKNQKSSINIYFLPVRSPTHPNSNSRAIQQSFKLFRVIKSYISLQHQVEDNIYLEDDICLHLSEYLYLKRVSRINFVLKLSGDEIDNRILQKVGEIKLPQEWLEKEQYRQKKQEIYCLHRDEQLMLKGLKKIKIEMLNAINEIRRLTGLKEEKYEDVNVQSLRRLKAEGLNERVLQLKEMENVRADLDLRLNQLEKRKKECEDQKSELQKTHVNQMLTLKNEVLSLQAQEPTPKYSGTQRFIYNRSKPAVQTRLITTIFSHANKKIDHFSDDRLTLNRNTIDKTNRFDSQLQKQNNRKSNDFKFAEKKVATVIKQGGSIHQQLDISKIREEYQNLIINEDFEAEKKLLAQQNRYQKATAALQRLLEVNQELNLEAL